MSVERDKIENLERRVAQLEDLVRKLVAARQPSGTVPAPPPRVEPRPSIAPSPGVSPPRTAKPAIDIEQWIGQKGLLAVGVFAIIATGGYLLKYAFDQGWVSPPLRVVGGVIAGVALAGFGERLLARGLRTYGASLVGAGGSLAYLALWAAAGPYEIVDRPVGVAILAVTTSLVGWRAVRHRVDALAIWALVGAYLAPLFLPQPGVRPDILLGYFAIVGFGAGAVALRLGWRTAFDLNLLGYFGLAAALGGQRFAPGIWMGYLGVGGAVAMLATGRGRWPEARVGAFVLSWALLFVLDFPRDDRLRWIDLSTSAVLLLAALWHQRATSPFSGPLGEQPASGSPNPQVRRPIRAPSVGEALLFILSPALFLVLAGWNSPTMLSGWAGALPAATAALYLGLGWPKRASHLVGMGFALLGWAVAAQYDDVPVALGLAALGVLAIVADGWAEQRGGRDVGVALLVSAFWNVFAVAQADLAATHRAFVGQWSLGWYGVVAASSVAAQGWRPRVGETGLPGFGRVILWSIAGLGLFLGGTAELQKLFAESGGAGTTLAGNLAISAYWLLYAAALVWAGFRVGKKPVRGTGLGLAVVAAAKVLLFDLSRLEALYRVGSTFALALIALGVAYTYNRRAKGAGTS